MTTLNPSISPILYSKRFTSTPLVNVLIELSPEHYERFIAGCDVASREYSLLKNAVVAANKSDSEHRVIQIKCDKGAAAILLGAATYLCPEAVPAIKAALTLGHEP
jgi:hypothetical protein